jgi:hypothetical protein
VIDTGVWGTWLIWVAAVLTVWSMVYYLQKALPEIRARVKKKATRIRSSALAKSTRIACAPLQSGALTQESSVALIKPCMPVQNNAAPATEARFCAQAITKI